MSDRDDRPENAHDPLFCDHCLLIQNTREHIAQEVRDMADGFGPFLAPLVIHIAARIVAKEGA